MPQIHPPGRSLAHVLGRSLVVAGSAAVLLANCAPADVPTGPAARPSSSLLAGEAQPSDAGRRLLDCGPLGAPLSASAVIGPSGGVLRLGGHALEVPAGAVLSAQLFTIAELPGRLMAVDVHAAGHASFQFRRPVTVTVDYSRCGEVTGPLRAWYVAPATHALLEDMGGVTDGARRTHSFLTPHLSVYAMAN